MQSVFRSAVAHRHVDGLKHEFGAQVISHCIPDHLPVGAVDQRGHSVESKLSSSSGFPGSDLHDRQHGHGGWRSEFTRGGSGGGGDVGEPV